MDTVFAFFPREKRESRLQVPLENFSVVEVEAFEQHIAIDVGVIPIFWSRAGWWE